MKSQKIILLISTAIFLYSAKLNAFEDPTKSHAGSDHEKIMALKLTVIEQQVTLLQQALLTQKKRSQANEKNWQINSYGSVLYKSEEIFANTQDRAPRRQASTDLERIVLEFVYDFSDKWQIETEIEFEHGGTGSALEYDGFEEFGEFETEVEAGGEVIVEKLQLKYQYNDNFTVKLGHIFVPFGLGTDLHKPNQYFTAQRHWSESTLVPQVWHETGINLITQWKNFTAQSLITTGLNSEYFRTYQWVATGHQKRFEKVNANDLALTLRLDYGDIKTGTGIGFSFYTGNTSGNRNNINKMSGNGKLTLLGFHGSWHIDDVVIRGQYLLGNLANSQEITLANKTTPGLKPGNFALLGSKAESAFIEAAYNSQTLLSLSQPLYFFTAYEFANPTKEVEQGLPVERFSVQELSFGINYLPVEQLIFKAQIAQQNYQQNNLESTQSISLSLGYYFSI